MSRVLRSTVPTTRPQRTPQIPDLEVVRSQDHLQKAKQKRNFDARHQTQQLPPLESGDPVWLSEREELVQLEMRWHHSHFRSRPQRVCIAETAAISSDSQILLKPHLRTRQQTRPTISQLNYAEVVDSHDLQKHTIHVPRTFKQLLCLNPKLERCSVCYYVYLVSCNDVMCDVMSCDE